MTTDSAALREYVEQYLPEDDVHLAARARGQELGCVPIGAGGGAALRFLATALQAKAVVEIGTGAGTSGLYLLAGMPQSGILTSIDVAPEHQRAAREAYAAAGISPSRTRLIMGKALDVLPRLTDAAYDLVFVDAFKPEYPQYLQHGVRMLRPGGVIAFDNVLWHGAVVDPSKRDDSTQAMRDIARLVKEDDRLVPVMLPLGDGLLVAARRP